MPHDVVRSVEILPLYRLPQVPYEGMQRIAEGGEAEEPKKNKSTQVIARNPIRRRIPIPSR